MICFHPAGSPLKKRLLMKKAMMKNTRQTKADSGVIRDFILLLIAKGSKYKEVWYLVI